MAKCKDCIHKDVCYLIEHYGKDLCSDEACDKFLATTSHKYSSCPYKYCPNCGAKMDGGDG